MSSRAALRGLAGLLAAAALCAAQSGTQKALTAMSAKCLGCHGAAQMSGLDMRTSEGLLKGGKRGPAVVPGDPEKSLLYQAARREGDLKMPPGKAAPLTDAETKAIADWIKAGAHWTDNAAAAAAGAWWSFRKPERPAIPVVKTTSWVRNPIDAFVLARLEAADLAPAAEADKRTLVRRAYFDLHGLPPSPEEIDKFVNDTAEDAYKKLVDRLLESPRYGERWGRYWLDLVRYADTSGFETDHFYLSAWRYRDWVIKAFNSDKPYDEFVKEQIAADELWPMNTDLEGTSKLPKAKEENIQRRIGTSLFTLGAFPIEYTYYGDQYRAEWMADAVETVGSAFLGLTLGCARCHDHKFDPFTQRDYYRLGAMFAGSSEREIPLGSLFDVQTASRSFPLLAHAEALKQMARGGARRRTPEEEDDAQRQEQQARGARPAMDSKRAELLQKLGEAYLRTSERLPTAHVLGHDEVVHDTYVLGKGDFKAKGEKVEPGFPAALNPGPEIVEPKGVPFVPQRRKALALWLTAPGQPLLGRVMVNRIWQGHFGDGIVRTPNDFGRQGDAPTHPELLDWLTTEFAARKWSIKEMHRLIMMSATYRQASLASQQTLTADPENRYFSRMSRVRLDGDSIRDSVLAVSGALNLKMGGVGIIPPLSKEEMLAARMPHLWPAHPNPAEHNRRSVYLQMKRSLTLPMLQTFDAPDTAMSCPRRERSTVAPQALALMNSEFASAQADLFAERIRKTAAGPDPSPDRLLETAWRLALGRMPSDRERTPALDYLRRNNLERLCLMIFNLNEFVYVD